MIEMTRRFSPAESGVLCEATGTFSSSWRISAMPERATADMRVGEDESQGDLRHAPRAREHPADLLGLPAEPAAADRAHDDDAHAAFPATKSSSGSFERSSRLY